MSEKANIKIPLTMTAVKKETNNFTSVLYRKPENFVYEPSQYCELYSPSAQKSGAYYIYTHPDEKEIGFLFQSNQALSKALITDSVQENIEASEPMGGFAISRLQGKTIYLVAEGFALAAMRPLVLEILKNRNDYGPLRLLYAAEDAVSFPFEEELNKWIGAFEYYDIVAKESKEKKWFGEFGSTLDILKKISPEPDNAIALIASEKHTVEKTRDFFLQQNFSEENILLNV